MKRLFRLSTVLYAAVVAVLAAVCFLFHTKTFSLWPGKLPRAYTDAREGGFSTAKVSATDSAVSFEAVLHSGLYHPHAGVEFSLLDGFESFSEEGLDFSDMDSAVVEFRATSDVVLVFYTKDPLATRPGDVLSLRPLRLDIPATRSYSEHRVSLSGLRPSAIWFDIHGLEQDENLFLGDVFRVAVETGRGTLLGLPTELDIRKLEIFGENRVLIRTCLFILILTTVLYLWVCGKAWKTKRKQNPRANPPRT